jgi:hypothetical protein
METREAANIAEENVSRNVSTCSTYVPCTFVEPEDRVHKILLFDAIVNQTNPVHILLSCSFKINFDILLPSAPWPSKRIRSVRLSYHADNIKNTYSIPFIRHFVYIPRKIFLTFRLYVGNADTYVFSQKLETVYNRINKNFGSPSKL